MPSILEILDNSGAKNTMATVKIPALRERNFDVHFKLDLMRKDLGLALSEIDKFDLDFPLSKKAKIL